MNSFAEPVGLALAGGGAHGAWQAGALRALTAAGMSFDRVLGFSAGALTGAGYALGIEDILEESWRRADDRRVLRLRPRLNPLTLCSGDSVREALRYADDEEDNRRRLRCDLTIVSLRVPQGEQEYARFTPGGADGWDGPLATKLVASCAIPGIFPPVLHGEQRYIDGGVPGREWMRFDALGACRTVLCLQMTRPEEYGRFRLLPWDRFDQTGRDVCYRQMACGIDSLLRSGRPPAIYRLYPSRRLPYSMLSFKSKVCAPAFEQGRDDARGFLSDPEPLRVREPLLAPEPLVPQSLPVAQPHRAGFA